MSEHRKYNIEHRKTRIQYMVYEDQVSWIKRNHDKDEFKSESEFVCRLLALGMNAYTNDKLESAADE